MDHVKPRKLPGNAARARLPWRGLVMACCSSSVQWPRPMHRSAAVMAAGGEHIRDDAAGHRGDAIERQNLEPAE